MAGGTGRKACNLCYQNAAPSRSTMSPVLLPVSVFSVLLRSNAQLIELHLVFKVIDVNAFKRIMCVSWVRALDECPPLAQRKLNPYTFVISCLIKSIQISVTPPDTFHHNVIGVILFHVKLKLSSDGMPADLPQPDHWPSDAYCTQKWQALTEIHIIDLICWVCVEVYTLKVQETDCFCISYFL